MSADLDRLLAELNVNPNTYTLVFSVDADTSRRIAADYARLRKVAVSLDEDALNDPSPYFSVSEETMDALDEWRAAKGEA